MSDALLGEQRKTVKLAVMKAQGEIVGAGFHYMVFPQPMDADPELHLHSDIFALMGWIIIEVEAEKAERILDDARAALKHQIEVAHLCETVLEEQRIRRQLGI